MLKNKKTKIFALLLALGFSFAGKSVQAAEDVNSTTSNNNQISSEDKDKDKGDYGIDKSILEQSTDGRDQNHLTDRDIEGINKSNKTGEDTKKTEENKKNNVDLNTADTKSKKNQWIEINGNLYYVTDNGFYKKTGWFKEKDVNPDAKNDNQYYIDTNFSAVVGWKKIEDKWYYFDKKGVKMTGWQTVDGSIYYLDSDGVMQKGWITDDKNNRYLLNEDGAANVGKVMIDNKWYLFNDTGALKSGFVNYKGKTYYCHEDGTLGENEYVKTSSNKYYVKSDGTIARGDIIIDGNLEKFDASGKYIGKGELKDYLYVKYLSVGDADCEYIKLPNGETVLIDTGDRTTSNQVVDFLKKQNLRKENGVPTIDYIVITHGHSDHIGGLSAILKNFNVKKVYLPKIARMEPWHIELEKDSSVSKEDLDMVKYDFAVFSEAEVTMRNKNMAFTNTVKGQYIDSQNILQFVESDMDFRKAAPNKLEEYWDLNDNSAVVYMKYGNTTGLFTGDLSWKGENQIYKNNGFDNREVQVLKAGHHGLISASTNGFLEYVKPKACVISRSDKSMLRTDTSYDNMINNSANVYDTSLGKDGGVSLYATKDNWLIDKQDRSKVIEEMAKINEEKNNASNNTDTSEDKNEEKDKNN